MSTRSRTTLAGKENIEAQLGSLVASSAENVLATQGNSTVAQGLVHAVEQMRSHDKKRALLLKALELKEDLPEALVELADLDLQEGRLEAAEKAFPAPPTRPHHFIYRVRRVILSALSMGVFSPPGRKGN